MAATPSLGGPTVLSPIIKHGPPGGAFTFWQHHLEYLTEQGPSFLDITDDVLDLVQQSGVHWGHVAVFSHHTTAAIRLQENEPLLIEDMCALLRRLAPPELDYRHNDFHIRTVNMTADESPNGHSHCQHLLLSTSETIPLASGALLLGQWQRLFLVELDNPRERRVTVSIMGVPAV